MNAKRLVRTVTPALAIAVAIAAAQSVVQAGEYWGAVAICPSCKSISWSYRYSNADAAKKAALDRVRRDHSTAKVVLVTDKAYIAVARSMTGGYGTGYGNSRSEAERTARNSCLKWNLTVTKVDVITNNDHDDQVVIVDPVNPAWSVR